MSRYIDYKKRCRRIPWGFYISLTVVILAAVALCLFLASLEPTEAKAAPAPVETVAPDPVEVVDLVPFDIVLPTSTVAVEEPMPEETQEPTVEEQEPVVNEQELEMLALVIYQEAGGDACSDECRQMVGEVALNRVASHIYPDTLYEVLTQYGQYGYLDWTGLVWPARADLPGEAHAVERAFHIAGALLTGSVERLLPEDAIFQAEFPQGSEILVVLDGLYFCR